AAAAIAGRSVKPALPSRPWKEGDRANSRCAATVRRIVHDEDPHHSPDHWQVRGGREDRGGGHGRGVQVPPPGDRPGRGDQTPGPKDGPTAPAGKALPAGVSGGSEPRPSARRTRPGLWP